MFKYYLVASSALVCSLLLMVVLRRLAFRTRVLVSGEIALVGGIGIGGALVVSSVLGVIGFGIDPGRIMSVLGISLAMLAFGVMDDLKEASVVQKLLLQSVCAVVLILIDVRTHMIYLNDWGNALVTFLWIIGITNAFNLLDVIDGLSAGVALTVTGAIFALTFFYPDVNARILALGLFAVITGFGFFNFPPARIYLGNAGSHFLGFVLAALALMVSYARRGEPVALLSPILLFWVPLLETAVLIYFRCSKRILPFNKSDDHMALRLVALGLTRKSALLVLLGLSLFAAVCGIILSQCDDWAGGLLILAVLLTSYIFFRVLMKAERNDR